MDLFSCRCILAMPAQHWDIEKLQSMIDVNLIGALHTLDVILPIFLEKNRGHLVLREAW